MARNSNQWRGRYNRAAGEAGERLAEIALADAGLEMIEPVHTAVHVTAVDRRTGEIRGHFAQRVSGDRRAVIPGTGRSVLVEIKTREADTLPIGVLRRKAHDQTETLALHAAAGGLSLVAWVNGADVAIVRWPVPGWQTGRPLRWPHACNLHAETVRTIRAESAINKLQGDDIPIIARATLDSLDRHSAHVANSVMPAMAEIIDAVIDGLLTAGYAIVRRD